MGYIRHDAIVATSWKTEHLVAAREKAVSLGLPCSEVVKSRLNGYVSFLIAPDGSKEGWTDSDEGDSARDQWKAWMRADDLYVDWAHVNFGGDDDDASTLRDHSGLESEVGGGGAEQAGDSAATKQSGAGSQNKHIARNE